jgi:hypothetical protein
MLVSPAILALPEFAGMRHDDKPIAGADESIRAKNENVGISDIEDISVNNDEMVIRIYEEHGAFIVGGHPFDLKEIRATDEAVSMLWYPPCPGKPEMPRNLPGNAWRVMQEQDFLSVRDWRNFPGYPSIRDGAYYIIQIKTASAYREFTLNNPLEYASEDNERFLTALAAIAAEFDMPACFAPQPQ